MRILLIDDSKTMRNIQKSVLNQLGFLELEEACDGQDALDKISEFKPELCLVDWNMPVMDGLTFVKSFRETDKTTPLIMVTTESEKARVSDQSRREQLCGETIHPRPAQRADLGNAC